MGDKYKLICWFIVGSLFTAACQNQKSSVKELADLSTLQIRYEPITGLGPEEGVVRRDPSDIIRVDGIYYLWYTKVLEGAYQYPEGFQGTLWYATSIDGINWQEQGKALGIGGKGSFDDFGVYTPNIMYAPEKLKYYLYYTGVPRTPEDSTKFIPGGRIGVAVADSPDGGKLGWKRCNEGNPVRRTNQDAEDREFGYDHVDDAALIIRDGRYYLYHKGHPGVSEKERMNIPKGTTPMGLAIATEPDGVFKLQPLDDNQSFLIQAGHEVLVWKHGDGLAALPMGHYRPETKNDFTVHYSEDGFRFYPVGEEVPGIRQGAGGVATNGLRAPGLFRPELTNPDAGLELPQWGISMTSYGEVAGLQRFIFEMKE